MKNQFIIITFILTLILSGCGDNRTSITTKQSSIQTKKAFFGDKENNKIIVVDVDNMKLLDSTETMYTGHKITYAVCNLKTLPKLYVSNRGSNAIDVIDTDNMQITKTIYLKHFPRSADAINNEFGLVAVSGMNKPMVSIIDMYEDKVVAIVGRDDITAPVESSNGSHACGHPYWLDKNHFILIDRAAKKIITYHIQKDSNGNWQTKQLTTLDTPTPAHQIITRNNNYLGDNDLFYLIIEGSDTLYPGIMELKLIKNKGLIYTKRRVLLKNKQVDISEMGAHHGDFVPTDTLMYVGSKEGMMYIIDYKQMKVKTILEAGHGAGHTKMIPEKDLAIVINHKDKFITVFDSIKSEIIKDIEVSNLPDSAIAEKTIQAHPNYLVSDDSKYFYLFLTEEARFVKIDLDSLELVDSIFVGGKPAMGTFQ